MLAHVRQHLALCWAHWRRITLSLIDDTTINLCWDLHTLLVAIGPVDNSIREALDLSFEIDMWLSLTACLMAFLRPSITGLNLINQQKVEIEVSMRSLRRQI